MISVIISVSTRPKTCPASWRLFYGGLSFGEGQGKPGHGKPD